MMCKENDQGQGSRNFSCSLLRREQHRSPKTRKTCHRLRIFYVVLLQITIVYMTVYTGLAQNLSHQQNVSVLNDFLPVQAPIRNETAPGSREGDDIIHDIDPIPTAGSTNEFYSSSNDSDFFKNHPVTFWILTWSIVGGFISFLVCKKVFCEWMPRFVEDWTHERASPHGAFNEYYYLQTVVYPREERRQEAERAKKNCPIKKRLRLLEALQRCSHLLCEEDLQRSKNDIEAGANIDDNMIRLPGNEELIPNTCAICLCDFEISETVMWSSNPNCHHCFHDDCILTWLVKIKEEEGTPCPCCRQEFTDLKPSQSDDINEEETEGTASSSSSRSNSMLSSGTESDDDNDHDDTVDQEEIPMVSIS